MSMSIRSMYIIPLFISIPKLLQDVLYYTREVWDFSLLRSTDIPTSGVSKKAVPPRFYQQSPEKLDIAKVHSLLEEAIVGLLASLLLQLLVFV